MGITDRLRCHTTHGSVHIQHGSLMLAWMADLIDITDPIGAR